MSLLFELIQLLTYGPLWISRAPLRLLGPLEYIVLSRERGMSGFVSAQGGIPRASFAAEGGNSNLEAAALSRGDARGLYCA